MSITLLFIKNVLNQYNDSIELTENKENIECKIKDASLATNIYKHISTFFDDCEMNIYDKPTKQSDGNYLFNIPQDLVKEKMGKKLLRLFNSEFTKKQVQSMAFTYLTFKNEIDKSGSFKTPLVLSTQKKKLEEILDSLHLKQKKNSSVSTQKQMKSEYISYRVIIKEGHRKDFLSKLIHTNITSPKAERVNRINPKESKPKAQAYLVETKSETILTKTLVSPISSSQASLFHHSSTNQDPKSPQAASVKEDIILQNSPKTDTVDNKEQKPEEPASSTVVAVKPSGCRCVIL